MPTSDHTDPELLQLILLDDEKAFNALFDRYWSKVYAVCYRYVKDEEAALEITHDIFLNIWKRRHELNIGSFKNYVLTSASYRGIRKKQELKAVPINYIEDYSQNEHTFALGNLSTTNKGEEKIGQEEFDEKIMLMLNELPKRCREIYLLSRKENLSIIEIAVKLNISKRTVENQLTTALKHLRQYLKYSGILLILMQR
ncbi:ECF RNA polymerase sigma factor SigK [Pedobacter sp. Bi27]|uniref:RNA polymerase sigma factor n=1 Tax=unclassified Pedobacter TaxID=2628915 RepID=UPI001D25AACC|nr:MULTISPECIES: RNA polymerase sigma-70 factor [unclassified Pedobacter]CAH0298632.1 ECF RNA polymerase sigma factor SigK [Pedobacter sp. Bi27]CAH0303010.1 ECF RNA polymerase sigma factor SigK [Pedobacter sp. Bi36]CAH0312451.1 ECF RNA polymerase sigma factor SigK [Pedobacter sp. Bi126]